MVQGLNSLKRKLTNLPKETRRHLQADLSVIGRELNVEQRGLVPVDDGELKSTIRTDELGGDRIGVAIRAGGQATTKPVRNGQDMSYDYSLAIEHGTADAPPQPFFYPPYRVQRRKIKRRATAAIKKAARSI